MKHFLDALERKSTGSGVAQVQTQGKGKSEAG